MKKILPIIKYPNQKLREKSREIPPPEIKKPSLKKLCANMIETMLEKDGVGLAAPQIGKNIKLIIINTKDGPIAMFNPRIIKKSFGKEWQTEGCLSVPGVFGEVKRNKKIKCCYLSNKAETSFIQASGLLARIIQHEIDHLEGILFIDKARNITKNEK